MAGFTMLFGVITAVVYLVFHLVTATGQVDYCYVDYSSYIEKAPERDKELANAEGNIVRKKYILYGHRPWKERDRALSQRDNLADLLKDAESLSCKVKTK
jgi:hypothetical protein